MSSSFIQRRSIKKDFTPSINKGIIILNVSQCNAGSVDMGDIQVNAGGSLNIQTWANKPGSVYSYSQATLLSVVSPFRICIVKGSENNSNPTPGTNSPVSGTITASSTP